MGIDYGLYVGPYVECKVQKVAVTKRRRACVNPNCDNHKRSVHSSAFCHLCGSRIDLVEYTEMEHAVSQWDLQEQIMERLSSVSGDEYWRRSREDDVHLWKPNVDTGGREYHLEAQEDFALHEITPDLVRDEVARFEAQFAPELTVFRERYGAGAVRVAWGIIQDYS